MGYLYDDDPLTIMAANMNLQFISKLNNQEQYLTIDSSTSPGIESLLQQYQATSSLVIADEFYFQCKRESEEQKLSSPGVKVGRHDDEDGNQLNPWFNDQLWMTSGLDYRKWICHLMFQLLSCQDGPFHNHATKNNRSKRNDKNTVVGSFQIDSFLSSCREVCLLKADVAEVIFQLLVNDVIQHALMSHDGDNRLEDSKSSKNIRSESSRLTESGQFNIIDSFSTYLHSLLLSTEIQHNRLICQSLFFVLRQQMSLFLTTSTSNTNNNDNKSKKTKSKFNKETTTQQKLPFYIISYFHLQYQQLAQIAFK
jgi:hypothetical protein